MKKVWKTSLMAMAVLLMANTAQAVVLWNDDMSSLDVWLEASNDPAEEGDLTGGLQVVDLDANPGPDAVQYNSWWGDDGVGGTAGWTSMWINSELVVLDETEYTLTVSMLNYAGGLDVPFSLQDTGDPNAWAVIVASPVQAIAEDVVTDYSISFSTVGGANSGVVGSELGITITPDWWNNGIVDNVSISDGTVVTPGDVDGNDIVDLIDYGFIRDNFYNTGASRTDGDLTADGIVDFDDFGQWKDNYPFPFTGGSSASVPEPCGAVLLAMGAVAGLLMRRHGSSS
jgi:hypothetical protein